MARKRVPRWALVVLALVVALLGTVLAILIPRWPYSESMLVPAIQDGFQANVKIERFRRFYFPHPGCAAEFVTLTRPGKDPSAAPLVTLQKMIVVGRYSDFLFRPHHLGDIKLDGLYVRVPPRQENAPVRWQNEGSQLAKISIGSVTANGAVLEIAAGNRAEPLKFEIHYLRVDHIAAQQPMSYQLTMGISEPPGEVESSGTFGPWQSGAIGKIALHGTAKLTDGKLDKYPGIGGTVNSEEHFSGTLQQIDIRGEARCEDFQLKKARHPMTLSSQFRLLVDGTSGEVQLPEVEAKIGKSVAQFHGRIAKSEQSGRRETSLDILMERGRVEDVLWLFNEEPHAAMRGAAYYKGHVLAPQFGPEFLKSLEMQGRFEITDAHFSGETQQKVNELSWRAQGKKIKDSEEPPEVTVDTLSSEVVMNNGVAHLSNADFEVPGAEARMHGNYSFLTHAINLHGDLRTEAKISQDSSGIKSVLLKPLDPLFRKKHAGAQIPVVMNGPIKHPHFGTDIVLK